MKEHLWFFFSLGAAILWGLQYATTEQLLKTVPVPLFTLAYALSLGAGYMLIFTWTKTELDLNQIDHYLTGKNILLFALIVLIGCISTLLIFSAIEQETAAKASIIEIMYPLFVALFAAVIYREAPLSWPTVFGG
jgi:drug/metabolite transporter (DMT)-like permease